MFPKKEQGNRVKMGSPFLFNINKDFFYNFILQMKFNNYFTLQ